MARSVPDIALMMTGCIGKDERDPMANPYSSQCFLEIEPANLKNVRAVWTEDFGGVAPLDDEIRKCFQDVIGALKNTFQSLEGRNPDFSDARDCFWTLRCVNYLASHKTRYENHRDILSQNIITNVEAGEKMSLSDVSKAETQWHKIYKDFEVFFENIDLLIVPGNATPAFRIDDGIPQEINGKKMENYMDASLIRSALTLTGHPVLALPCGYDHLGLPFGLQLVGKRRGDIELLEIAMALESIFSSNPSLTRAIPNLKSIEQPRSLI